MKKETKWWIDSADYDLKTAKHMLDTRRYVYVVFLCHLTIERLLKACIIEFKDKFPKPVHDLNLLTESAAVEFPEEMRVFISTISKEAIKTRYDEDRSRYNRKYAQECLAQTQKVVRWLKRLLK